MKSRKFKVDDTYHFEYMFLKEDDSEGSIELKEIKTDRFLPFYWRGWKWIVANKDDRGRLIATTMGLGNSNLLLLAGSNPANRSLV